MPLSHLRQYIPSPPLAMRQKPNSVPAQFRQGTTLKIRRQRTHLRASHGSPVSSEMRSAWILESRRSSPKSVRALSSLIPTRPPYSPRGLRSSISFTPFIFMLNQRALGAA